MAVNNRTIKGDPCIVDGALVQKQFLIILGTDKTTKTTEGLATLIPNVWEDLMNSAGTVKTNGKGFWYWDVKISDPSNDGMSEITITFEAPRPDPKLFWSESKGNYDFSEGKNDSDWTKFWKKKMKTGTENYEYKSSLQPREIIFPGTKYIDQEGNTIEVPENKIQRSDLGDISNLLGAIY